MGHDRRTAKRQRSQIPNTGSCVTEEALARRRCTSLSCLALCRTVGTVQGDGCRDRGKGAIDSGNECTEFYGPEPIPKGQLINKMCSRVLPCIMQRLIDAHESLNPTSTCSIRDEVRWVFTGANLRRCGDAKMLHQIRKTSKSIMKDTASARKSLAESLTETIPFDPSGSPDSRRPPRARRCSRAR